MSSTFANDGSPAISRRTKARQVPFEGFYKDEYRSVLGLAIALTADRAAAEDLVQEAFLTAHRRWDRISQYDNPPAWLRRVLINRAVSRRRRLGAEMRAVSRFGSTDTPAPDLTPDTEVIWAEVRKLPRRQQQAVALHYVGQLSIEEIAGAMGCSGGAVKSHLHRARQALRAPLAAWNEEGS